MRVVRWLGKNVYYFTFGAVLILTSSAIVFAGNNFSFSALPGADKRDDSPVLIVKADPVVQSAQTDTEAPSVNPEDDYYIDENGNWIAGTAPPKPEPEPQTSSWCGEKKRKKWLGTNCEDISCPDISRGSRIDWYNPCDPCEGRFLQRVCAYQENRDDD